jgi:transcriptional regulator with XRE-family HTH domain
MRLTMTFTMTGPNLIHDREATVEKQLSVSEVAERLGVTPRTVVRWIRDKVAFPNAYQKNPHLKTSPFVIPLEDVKELEDQRRVRG